MIKKELSVFFLVGSLTVGLDYIFYQGLVLLQLFSVEVSKGLGFIFGTLFAYLANRFWTFSHKKLFNNNVIKFVMLYITTLCINVSFNSMLLYFLAEFNYALQISFFFATTVSASLNFLGMKFIVFNPVGGGKTL